MKKVLFICLSLLVAATTFVGCKEKPQDEPTSDVTITLDPATLLLSPGESVRLSKSIAPAGTTLTVNWSSSNTAVATVSASGLVTAVAEGQATISCSAAGANSGTCEVTVSNEAIYESFALSDYGIFGEPAFIEGTDTTFTFRDGSSYKCQLASVYLVFWGSGLVHGNDGFSGAGFIGETDANVYFITEGDYAGSYVGLGAFFIHEDAANFQGWDDLPAGVHTGEAGSINCDLYGQFWEEYLVYVSDTTQKMTVKYADACPGAQLYYYDADNNEDSWYLGAVTDAAFGEDENDELLYRFDIKWYDFTSDDFYYGIKVTYGDDGYINGIVKPYEFNFIDRSFTNMSAEEEVAPRICSDHLYIGEKKPELNTRAIPTTKFFKK